MENDKVTYIKADGDKIINEKAILWIKKMDECLEVCTKSTGCNIRNNDTHRICKLNNHDSYDKLNSLF
jgi:hypothetical protein